MADAVVWATIAGGRPKVHIGRSKESHVLADLASIALGLAMDYHELRLLRCRGAGRYPLGKSDMQDIP